jgi:hypothetical protein
LIDCGQAQIRIDGAPDCKPRHELVITDRHC